MDDEVDQLSRFTMNTSSTASAAGSPGHAVRRVVRSQSRRVPEVVTQSLRRGLRRGRDPLSATGTFSKGSTAFVTAGMHLFLLHVTATRGPTPTP